MSQQKEIGINDVVDELVYASYAHNRRIAPHVSPERWARVYGNGPALESRFQREGGMQPQPGMQ